MPHATVFDLGANAGEFSRALAGLGANVVAFDLDRGAVEGHYQSLAGTAGPVLPLVSDLTNPSPGLGWAGEERKSLAGRGPVDLILAVALVHHLAIGNNVPLPHIARFFARLGS